MTEKETTWKGTEMNVIVFCVSGRGRFPLELLSKFRCWPHNRDSCKQIRETQSRFTRGAWIETCREIALEVNEIESWSLAGWRVTEQYVNGKRERIDTHAVVMETQTLFDHLDT